MSRPKIHKRGNYSFYYRQFDVNDFDNLGTPPDPEFKRQVQADGFVVHDIILTKWEEEIHFIDGRRRILACQALLAEDYKEFGSISGKVFLDISPDDQAAWAIISNEHRSENLIDYYLKYLQLKERRDWEEIAVQYRLNRSRWKVFDTLDKLEHPDKFIACHISGGITFNNLKSVARLSPARQDTLLEKVTEKNRITITDIKVARRATQVEVLASSPSFAVPDLDELAQAETVIELFLPGDVAIGDFGDPVPYEAAKAVAEEKNWFVYRLVEV